MSPLFVPEHQTVSTSRPSVVARLFPPDVVLDDLPCRPAPGRVGQSVAAQPHIEGGETAWGEVRGQRSEVRGHSDIRSEILTAVLVEEKLQVVDPLPGAELGQPPVPGVSAQGGRQTVSPEPGEAGLGW